MKIHRLGGTVKRGWLDSWSSFHYLPHDGAAISWVVLHFHDCYLHYLRSQYFCPMMLNVFTKKWFFLQKCDVKTIHHTKQSTHAFWPRPRQSSSVQNVNTEGWTAEEEEAGKEKGKRANLHKFQFCSGRILARLYEMEWNKGLIGHIRLVGHRKITHWNLLGLWKVT